MTNPETFEPVDNRGALIVPFFPTHWQENANAIFNNDFTVLQGSLDNLSAALKSKQISQLKSEAEYNRPTSGKHF